MKGIIFQIALGSFQQENLPGSRLKFLLFPMSIGTFCIFQTVLIILLCFSETNVSCYSVEGMPIAILR